MPYPHPGDLANLKARLECARQAYTITQHRYDQGTVSAIRLDGALAHLIRLQDTYIRMLELRLARRTHGKVRRSDGS